MKSNPRNVLTAFIASPGDVVEERRIVRDVVDGLNKGVGRRLGWHIDLLGWEDANAGFGRPQDIINAELDQADVFLAILHKRWGSPTGDYDSGFEEEFERAMARRKDSESPEILLAFKRVKDITDPGPQLRRVLEFRQQLIESKEVFFKEVEDALEWERLVRDRLVMLLLDRSESSAEVSEVPRGSIEVAKKREMELEKDSRRAGGGLADEVLGIAEELRGLTKDVDVSDLADLADHLEPYKIARIHLASQSAVSRRITSGVFGVHETNTLYANRAAVDAGYLEFELLMRTLLADGSDVIPGWYWVADLSEGMPLLWIAHRDGNPAVRAGALRLARDLNERPNSGVIEEFFGALLAETNPTVTAAAGQYLEAVATPDDIPFLEDVLARDEANDPARAQRLLQRLKVRRDPEWAFGEWATEGDLPQPVADELGAQSETLHVNLLQSALRFENPDLRMLAGTELLRREKITLEDAEHLTTDKYRALRGLGFTALARLGSAVDIDEVEASLQLPESHEQQKPGGLLASILGGPPGAKHDVLDSTIEIEVEVLRHVDRDELRQRAQWIGGEAAYRALLDEHLDEELDNVRLNLGARFQPMKEEWLTFMEQKYGRVGRAKLEDQAASVDRFVTEKYAEIALRALLNKATPADAALASKYLNAQIDTTKLAAIELLKECGDSSHAASLVELADQSSGQVQAGAARAALALDPEAVAVRFIDSGDSPLVKAALSFAIERDLDVAGRVLSLLQHEKQEIRAFAVAYLATTRPADALEEFLKAYVTAESYYYNVVVWLDRFLYAPDSARGLFHSQLRSLLT